MVVHMAATCKPAVLLALLAALGPGSRPVRAAEPLTPAGAMRLARENAGDVAAARALSLIHI